MSRKTEGWIFSIFAISMVVFAFAPPVVYWNKCELFALDAGPCIAQFVDRFQTLITGLAAVIGAFFTVRAMHLTDKESERQHNQLMGLSLRADALTIDRFYQAKHQILSRNISDIRNSKIFEASNLKDQEGRDVLSNELVKLRISTSGISALCSEREMESVQRFLNGDMENTVKDVKKNSVPFIELIDGVTRNFEVLKLIDLEIKTYGYESSVLNAVDERIEQARAKIDEIVGRVEDQKSELATRLNAFITVSEELSSKLFDLHSRYEPYIK